MHPIETYRAADYCGLGSGRTKIRVTSGCVLRTVPPIAPLNRKTPDEAYFNALQPIPVAA